MTATAPARIRVFWQPGCTSCLRVKEFLAGQGIEFESIDVHNDAHGRDQLEELGVRTVPVVALAGRYTLAQSIHDVVKFLDLKTSLADPLPPAELVVRLDLILRAATRYVRQFSPAQLAATFRNRDRTVAALAFHVFRVAEMGWEATQGMELHFGSFDDLPPPEWGAEAIVRFGDSVRSRLAQWWREETDQTLQYRVPTYYGQRTMHEVLERTTWHAAQHTRQLMLILESHGIAPDQPLMAEDLAGLPLPEAVWDR